jgi:hypothetical protein
MSARAFGSSITLFERMNTAAEGFSAEQVADAAVNLLIREVTYRNPNPDEAVQAWTALFADARNHLADCYDETGRKKTYSYHRVVEINDEPT